MTTEDPTTVEPNPDIEPDVDEPTHPDAPDPDDDDGETEP